MASLGFLPVAFAVADKEENRATSVCLSRPPWRQRQQRGAAALSVNFTQRLASASLKEIRAQKVSESLRLQGDVGDGGFDDWRKGQENNGSAEFQVK